MKCLSQHIAYLISRHDCVVVPGWGAFISSYISASFDSDKGVMAPPSRVLTYNPGVTHNDGMLSASVARREGIPYERAAERVSIAVASMREVLESTGELTIDGVGRFSICEAGTTPVFEPAADCAANACYAMLPAIEVSHPARHEDMPAVRPYRAGFTGRAARAVIGVAASFAILLGLGFTLTMPDSGQERNDDYASVISTPRISSAKAIADDDVMSQYELFVAMPTDADASVAVDTAAHSTYRRTLSPGLMQQAAEPVSVSDRSQADAAGGYYVVVASLETRSRAERFIRNSGDQSLRILKSGPGRYRVYAAESSTFEGAMALRDAKVSRRYADAWVYAR